MGLLLVGWSLELLIAAAIWLGVALVLGLTLGRTIALRDSREVAEGEAAASRDLYCDHGKDFAGRLLVCEQRRGHSGVHVSGDGPNQYWTWTA